MFGESDDEDYDVRRKRIWDFEKYQPIAGIRGGRGVRCVRVARVTRYIGLLVRWKGV